MNNDYINPLNPYTGEVSVMALMENQKNGHTKYPENMGSVTDGPDASTPPLFRTEGNDFMIAENTDASQKADCSSVPCLASFEIYELREFAFRALPKKELVRLLVLVGEPPQKSADRQRNLMALRLARYADRVTISVEWDSRMPNT
jgi:hypothetical protein